MASSDRPNILEGIGKDFLGVPFSLALTRRDQHLREAVRTNERLGAQEQRLVALGDGQNKELQVAQGALGEARREREIVERSVAPALSSLARSSAVTNDRLETLRAAFEEGHRHLDARNQARTDAMMGIPAPRRDVGELVARGQASETELITLARRGALSAEARRKLQENLPSWKTEVIASGLLNRPDPRREKCLSDEQRTFLWELRRSDGTPTEQMRSLTAVARSGQLDPDAHWTLARQIRSLRTGTEGAALSLQEVTEQGEVANQQRAVAVHLARAGLIEQQKANSIGTAHLAVSERQAEDTQDIRESNRAIAREMATSVQLGRRQADGIDTLGRIGARQVEQLDGIGSGVATLGIIGQAQLNLAESMNRQLRGMHSTELAQLQEIEGLRHAVSVTNDFLGGLTDLAAAQHATAERAAESLARVDAHLQTAVLQLDGIHASMERIAKAHRQRDVDWDRIRADESFRKAMTVLERGRVDKAIHYLDESHERWPNDPRTTFHRALCHIARDEARRAREDLIETLDMLPAEASEDRGSVRLYLARLAWCEARAQRRSGDTGAADARIAEAVELATVASEEAPTIPEAKVALAQYLCELGATERALDVLFDVLASHPDRCSAIAASSTLGPVHAVLQRALSTEDGRPFMVRLASDAVGLGMEGRALRLLGETCRYRPRDLLAIVPVADTEFAPVWDALHQRMMAEIGATSGPESRRAEDWYALAVLALRLDAATDAQVLRLFNRGAAIDPNVKRRDRSAVRRMLSELAGIRASDLFAILDRDWDQPYPWLSG